MASGAHKVDITWDRRPAGVVAHLVFDNARRLNVLNPPALLDLTEAFVSLAREDDLRVIVFSGAGGRAFIGGADINHMTTMKHPEDGRRFLTMIHKLCQAIRDVPVPVICKAEAWGLVEEVVPVIELDQAMERCVQAIVDAAPLAVRAQKRLMRRWERLSIDEGIQAGIDAMAESVADGEHLERMTAFVNRKKKG